MSGVHIRKGPYPPRCDAAKDNVQCEPKAQIENDADDGWGDAAESSGRPGAGAETLDIGHAY
jgi:hypothetical protein